MKKWKKLLITALCCLMLQMPEAVLANAVVTETAVTQVSSSSSKTVLNGLVKKGSKRYYYKNGVKQKNRWVKVKGYYYYFGKNGVAYAAPNDSAYKQNIIVKKINGKTYGFDRSGRKVTNGVYADAAGKAYCFDKKGVLDKSKTNQINKAAKYMASSKKLRGLLGKPLSTKASSSCLTEIKKDYTLTYRHIMVMVGKRYSGGEIVYGIQAR